MRPPQQRIVLAEKVERALRQGAAVVALESTILTHGLPRPENLRAALEFGQSVSEAGAVPATPWLTVTSEQCRGANSAEWTASNGATSYELWGSSASTFSPSSLYYSGSGTLKIVNVGGTTYLHVRACNANGCSAFSNTGVATAISGCK